MTETKRGFFRSVWQGIDCTRRVVINLVFVAVVVALIVMALQGGGPDVPETAALVVAPAGRIVEQLGGDPMQRAIEELTGTAEPQTLDEHNAEIQSQPTNTSKKR